MTRLRASACFRPARGVPTLAAALAVMVTVAGCQPASPPDARFTTVPQGDRDRGRDLMAQYQCGRCHTIPDVPAAEGRIGPSLAQFARRSYIAGQLPNGPQALQRWLQDPAAAVPGTTMPKLGVSPGDARDIAAYLLSLR
ncbi:c-type cytochrome [Piscinibacter sp. XHJ-5]|uniref:c-type cytochrome n=1 Tax=Piscinibacter sp. XHJ-5 TaxID=3037797 RepID=UPI002452FC9E|nr:c-type cytochrome [Piscinibacter sp. XHJ-5]